MKQLKQFRESPEKILRLQSDSNSWPPRYQCDALPTELIIFPNNDFKRIIIIIIFLPLALDLSHPHIFKYVESICRTVHGL